MKIKGLIAGSAVLLAASLFTMSAVVPASAHHSTSSSGSSISVNVAFGKENIAGNGNTQINNNISHAGVSTSNLGIVSGSHITGSFDSFGGL